MKTFVLFLSLVMAAVLTGDELTPAERQEFQRRETYRLWLLETQKTQSLGASIVAAQTACGNGDFETDIATSTEWSGAYGSVPPSGNPNFSSFTAGLAGGPLTAATSHQTWVAAGMDPIVPINQVAPGGSTHAVRIGNAVNGYGSELLAKTFTVTAANALINFSYALVFQDPGHPPHQQPSFWVRVVDSSGAPLTGVVDLGNGSDKAVADGNNPFFVKKPGTIVVYRDWSCAQIDLEDHIGKTVTIQFITEDCAQGAHYGYAYLDNVCEQCIVPPGQPKLELDAAASSTCGPGKLCFTYALPIANGVTGTAQIKLEIRQNNAVVATLNSGTLSGGTQYCFNINSTTLPGITGTFDYSATGTFTINNSVLAPLSTPRTSYEVACPDSGCCPGPNLITGGDFETGNGAFSSVYQSVSGGTVLPGQYALLNTAQAASASSTWNVQNQGSCSTSGKTMVVNGSTGKSGSAQVWKQTVNVTPGEEYRFCANFRNLPACAMDVKPKIEIRFSSPPNTTAVSTISANAANACDWIRETRTILIPPGVTTLTTEIWLDETGLGDGNDVAIDNISLHQTQPANPIYTLLNIQSTNVSGSIYNLTATPVQPQIYGYYWEVCEVNTAGNCIASTQVVNPSQWWNLGPNNFSGYNGTNVLAGTAAGVFDVLKKYKVRYGVFDTCIRFTSSEWYFGFNPQAGQVVFGTSMSELEKQ